MDFGGGWVQEYRVSLRVLCVVLVIDVWYCIWFLVLGGI